jgi:SAM-dependent methyltransferase
LLPSFFKAPDLSWQGDAIADAWFGSHFNYAADVVAEWVGAERLHAGRSLDFGCGDGITALGLILRHGARHITGIDISQTHRGLAKLARREIKLAALPPQLKFQRIQAGAPFAFKAPFDLIMSWSTFEHIELPYLGGVLDNLHQSLSDDGLFFLQINPLYYSPHGSHLSRFELPAWAHLLWTPDQVTAAVMDYQGDIPADELEENFHTRDFKAYKAFVLKEYDQLNRVTTSALIAHLHQHGFEVVRQAFGQVAGEPPASLLARFEQHDLVTDEVRLLLKKR